MANRYPKTPSPVIERPVRDTSSSGNIPEIQAPPAITEPTSSAFQELQEAFGISAPKILDSWKEAQNRQLARRTANLNYTQLRDRLREAERNELANNTKLQGGSAWLRFRELEILGEKGLEEVTREAQANEHKFHGPNAGDPEKWLQELYNRKAPASPIARRRASQIWPGIKSKLLRGIDKEKGRQDRIRHEQYAKDDIYGNIVGYIDDPPSDYVNRADPDDPTSTGMPKKWEEALYKKNPWLFTEERQQKYIGEQLEEAKEHFDLVQAINDEKAKLGPDEAKIQELETHITLEKEKGAEKDPKVLAKLESELKKEKAKKGPDPHIVADLIRQLAPYERDISVSYIDEVAAPYAYYHWRMAQINAEYEGVTGQSYEFVAREARLAAFTGEIDLAKELVRHSATRTEGVEKLDQLVLALTELSVIPFLREDKGLMNDEDSSKIRKLLAEAYQIHDGGDDETETKFQYNLGKLVRRAFTALEKNEEPINTTSVKKYLMDRELVNPDQIAYLNSKPFLSTAINERFQAAAVDISPEAKLAISKVVNGYDISQADKRNAIIHLPELQHSSLSVRQVIAGRSADAIEAAGTVSDQIQSIVTDKSQDTAESFFPQGKLKKDTDIYLTPYSELLDLAEDTRLFNDVSRAVAKWIRDKAMNAAIAEYRTEGSTSETVYEKFKQALDDAREKAHNLVTEQTENRGLWWNEKLIEEQGIFPTWVWEKIKAQRDKSSMRQSLGKEGQVGGITSSDVITEAIAKPYTPGETLMRQTDGAPSIDENDFMQWLAATFEWQTEAARGRLRGDNPLVSMGELIRDTDYPFWNWVPWGPDKVEDGLRYLSLAQKNTAEWIRRSDTTGLPEGGHSIINLGFHLRDKDIQRIPMLPTGTTSKQTMQQMYEEGEDNVQQAAWARSAGLMIHAVAKFGPNAYKWFKKTTGITKAARKHEVLTKRLDRANIKSIPPKPHPWLGHRAADIRGRLLKAKQLYEIQTQSAAATAARVMSSARVQKGVGAALIYGEVSDQLTDYSSAVIPIQYMVTKTGLIQMAQDYAISAEVYRNPDAKLYATAKMIQDHKDAGLYWVDEEATESYRRHIRINGMHADPEIAKSGKTSQGFDILTQDEEHSKVFLNAKHTAYGEGTEMLASLGEIIAFNSSDMSPKNYEELRKNFLDEKTGKSTNAAIAAYDLYLSMHKKFNDIVTSKKNKQPERTENPQPFQMFILDQLTGIQTVRGVDVATVKDPLLRLASSRRLRR